MTPPDNPTVLLNGTYGPLADALHRFIQTHPHMGIDDLSEVFGVGPRQLHHAARQLRAHGKAVYTHGYVISVHDFAVMQRGAMPFPWELADDTYDDI